MIIQVLGSGCPTCKQLLETTRKVVEDLKINADVEYITDVSKMIKMGIMTSPVLAVDGKVVLTGGGRSEEEIRGVICDGKCEEGEMGCSCKYCC
ncbi:thioredoxin family protein [bacterium]|nr:thioredoxin family protein [bacterium]